MQPWFRLGAYAALAAAAATPGYAQRDRDSGPADRCESTDCFNQLQIRDIEVIDQTTLLIYVGGQRCPFLVEMTGTFCDLTFLPPFQVVFRPTQAQSRRTAPIVGGQGTAPDGGGPVEQTRICASDIDIGLRASPFNTAVGGFEGDATTGLSCRIQNVRSLTDDERVEIYVDGGISAPPPPFGTGTVESPENPEEPEARPAEESDRSSRRRRDDDDRRRRRRDREDEEE